MKRRNVALTASGALVAAALSGLVAGSAYADSGSAQGITKANVALGGVAAGFNPLNEGGTHDCKGHNACKGQGGCKTGDNGCKGKNSCKGKGGCSTSGTHEE